MKNIHILLIALLFLFSIDSSAKIIEQPIDSTSQDQSGSIILPKFFYKRFEGSINSNLNIVMNLIRNDTLLNGNYYYETTGMPVSFTFNSHIYDDSSIYIEEETGQQTNNNFPVVPGRFKGKFINEHTIMGIWQKLNNPASYYFTLMEKYPAGSVKLNMKEYGKNYVYKNGENADISFSFPQLNNYPDKNIQDTINYYLVNTFLKDYNLNEGSWTWLSFNEIMNDFLDRYKKSTQDNSLPADFKHIWENSFSTNVLFNSNNILSVEDIEFRFEGGAHPLTGYIYSNYNLLTGKKITLDELLKSNYKEALDKIGERRFKAEHYIKQNDSPKTAGYFIDNNEFHLNNNFTISKLGLTFRFREYEIGPYVMGAPSVFIPYNDFRYLIKSGSLLEQVLK
jgi:hypothetical protein